MANNNFPFGLMPEKKREASWDVYPVAPTYATALFVGDPVKIVTDGTAERGNPLTANAWAGVIVGFVDPEGGVNNHYPGTTEGWQVIVDVNPDTVFLIQEDSVGGALVAGDAGMNALIVTGAGNDDNGRSGAMLDSSSAATTATHQLKILGPDRATDNEVGQDYARWRVMINNHQFAGDKAGI